MKILLVILMLSVQACELEESDPPPGDDPGVLYPDGVDGAAPCPAPEPTRCRQGYTLDYAPDGARVFCMRLAECPILRNPCTQGTAYGDPAIVVLCEGA